MYLSIFTDELALDYREALPILKSWGFESVDFRSMINGKGICSQSDEELKELKKSLDKYGLKCGVLQTSLAKVHLPDKETQQQELEKLYGIIRASNILGTNKVRSFNYWQQEPGDRYFNKLQVMPDQMNQVLERFDILKNIAYDAGLELSFENCGQTVDEVVAFLKAINVPTWGLAWDCANYFDILAKDDESAYFKKSLEYANLIHVKSWGVIPEFNFTPVPYEKILRAVSTLKKEIPISVETHNIEASPFTNAQASKLVYEHIKSVWPKRVPASIDIALENSTTLHRRYEDNPVRFTLIGSDENISKRIEETNGCKLSNNDQGVEVVYITKGDKIYEALSSAIQSNKHVLLKKSIDIDIDSYKELKKKAKERELLLEFDYDTQFDMMYLKLKEALNTNFFGKILSVHSFLKVSDLTLFEHTAAEVDNIVSLFGLPEYVWAIVDNDLENKKSLNVVLKYKNSFSVSLNISTGHIQDSRQRRFEIYGSVGAFSYTQGGPEKDHTYWFNNNIWSELSPFNLSTQAINSIDYIAYRIRENRASLECTSDSLDTLLVLSMIKESVKNDGVKLKVANRGVEG